jgi:hypothetical protein
MYWISAERASALITKCFSVPGSPRKKPFQAFESFESLHPEGLILIDRPAAVAGHRGEMDGENSGFKLTRYPESVEYVTSLFPTTIPALLRTCTADAIACA